MGRGFDSPHLHNAIPPVAWCCCGPVGDRVAGRWRARPLCVPVGGGLPACCLLPRQISGRRVACPPARRPRRELRSARRLEARPGPAAAHGHRSLARCFLWASWGSRVLSFWGARVRVVTNVVNLRCFSCGFLPRCYERRQSKVFFVWISDPLLQTSSIRGLFR